MGDPAGGMVQRMDQLKTRWLARITAYVTAIVVGLSVVVGAALVLEARNPEPGQYVVLLVMGAAALVSIFLGRVTYRAVSSLIDDAPNTPN
jgi:hypothetical protein